MRKDILLIQSRDRISSLKLGKEIRVKELNVLTGENG
jgi:hypothetical protein